MTAPRATAPVVGAPLDRVDGRLKVTGGAKYSAEYPLPKIVHATLITSTVAKGRVRRIDDSAARRMPGVLAVLTPQNAPRLPGAPQVASGARHDQTSAGEVGGRASQGGREGQSGQGGRPMFRVPTLLQDDVVHYNGQPIGVVVADTLDHALAAVDAIRVTYDEEKPVLDMATAPRNPPDQVRPLGGERTYRRGDVDAGLREADVRVDQTYTTPLENHNPMEVHNTTAVWEGDHLTLYDSTQGIFSVRNTVAQHFGIPRDRVRVISYFTGGGFGSKGGAWSHQTLAAMAAKQVGRPVKLVLTRRQMFGPTGGRARTVQRLTLGARRDGTLTAVRHHSTSNTSTLEDFVEGAATPTRMLYAVPNMETQYDLVRLNVGSPTFMRAPGESTGTYSLEVAMDELAYALGMDPVALRLKNYAERDPESGRPWSSKGLRQCYELGASKFGWSRRSREPRSMRDGRWLVGWGMATATYPARTQQSAASARMLADGRVEVRAGSQEIGCGTYTIMTQIAADALGVPADRVRFELGDTEMPETPSSVGSVTAASTGTAVHNAAAALREKLVQMAVRDSRSPLSGASVANVKTGDGRLSVDGRGGETYADVVARNGNQPVEVTMSSQPGAEQQQYAGHSFGAVFAEVRVDPELGLVRVPRVVTAHDIGRVVNEKTARSQISGGVVWGIGMALLEETHVDARSGRYLNADLAEYQVPVNADVGTIDVNFVDVGDPHLNPVGIKGAGEIGITGVPAAIANAIHHATGKRVRDLPVRLDQLL